MTEHPDDKDARLESEAWAKTAIEAFCKANHAKLVALIQTYADLSAEEQLQDLREKFWSQPMVNQ